LKEALTVTLTAGASKDKNTCKPYGREDIEAYLLDGTDSSRFANAFEMMSTLFATTNGFMGIGSSNMQIGDSICVLFGGEVLFILRPFKDGYQLVGECYVHGLMHGEDMEMVETGEAKEQWFDLQ
jgi:hypothetical protein